MSDPPPHLEPPPDPDPAPVQPRELRIALALVLVGLVARLLCASWIGPVEPFGDQRSYVDGAASLLDGETYAERRGPAYPALLAAFQGLFGRGNTTSRVGNALLGAATILLVWCFARRVLRPRTALLAAGILALHPRFVTEPAYLLSENLYVPLVVGACLALGRAVARPAPLAFAAAGAVLGLAALTRSMMLWFVPVAALIVAAYAGQRTWRTALARAGPLLLGALVVVAPWTVRNALVLHAFVPIDYADGIPLFEGNYVEGEPGDMKRERQELNLLFYRQGGDSELYANRRMREVALGIIRERQPAWAFEKLAENGPRLYTPVLLTPYPWELREEPASAPSARLLVAWHLAFHLFVLLLFPLGLAVLPLRPAVVAALVYTGYSAAVHVVANAGYARFQMPYEWFLVLLACAVLDRGFPRGRGRLAAGLGGLAVVLLAQLPLLGWWRRLLRTLFLGDA